MGKILVCFGVGLSEQKPFQDISNKFRGSDFEVHLFDNIVEMDLMPHSVLNVLEHVWKDSIDENEYYFFSNVEDFFKLCYRVLHHTFKDFIFWNDGIANSYNINSDNIYDILLSKDIVKSENISKPIYLNEDKELGDPSLNNNKRKLEDFFSIPNNNYIMQQTIYCYSSQCYMLEPSFGDVVYVYLDEEKVLDMSFSNFVFPDELDTKIIVQVEEIFELIAKDVQTVIKRQEVLHKLFTLISSVILTLSQKKQKYYISLLAMMGTSYGLYAEVYTLSFLLQTYKRSFFYQMILQRIFSDSELNVQQKYFILFQARHVGVSDHKKFAKEILLAETQLYRQICNGFLEFSEEKFSNKDDDITKDNVVIFTSQFLNANHIPTLYTLETARYLIEKANKNVYIINTCEYLTQIGRVPFFDISAANVQSEYSKSNVLEYGDLKIPFIQMISSMPSIGGIDGIIEFLEENRPGLIINISDLSVIGGICSDYFRTISLPVKNDVFVPIKGILVNYRELSDEIKQIYADAGVEIVEYEKPLYDVEDEKSEGFLDDILSKVLEKIDN